MNREIKFRNAFLHKDGSFSHFCYWGAINTKGEPLSDDGCFVSPSSSNGLDKQWHQQYTGLKDKNGKEIYEGDMLNYKRTGDNWAATPTFDKDYEITVGFKNGMFICNDSERSLFDYIKCITYKQNNWTDWEIIGNIYENPTLLQ